MSYISEIRPQGIEHAQENTSWCDEAASALRIYAYVNNDPLNATDPSGNCPWCLVGAVVGGGVEAYLQYRHGDLGFTFASLGKIAVAAGAGAATGGVGVLLEGAGAGAVATVGTTAFYGATTEATAYTVNSCAIDRSCSPAGLGIAALGGALDAGGGGAAADIAGRLAGRFGSTAGTVTKGVVGSASSAGVGVEADSITESVNSQAQGKAK